MQDQVKHTGSSELPSFSGSLRIQGKTSRSFTPTYIHRLILNTKMNLVLKMLSRFVSICVDNEQYHLRSLDQHR